MINKYRNIATFDIIRETGEFANTLEDQLLSQIILIHTTLFRFKDLQNIYIH